VFRANHPEIFQYAAEEFLDKSLGAVNTAVLIFSSLTMAWAVRSAQLNHRTALITLLAVTIACGFVFLGVKYVEYKHKWEEGLLWASQYDPVEHGHGSEGHGGEGQQAAEGAAAGAPQDHGDSPDGAVAAAAAGSDSDEHGADTKVDGAEEKQDAVNAPAEDAEAEVATDAQIEDPVAVEAAPVASEAGADTDTEGHSGPRVDQMNQIVSTHGDDARDHEFRTEPKNVGVFFSIYFVMTGLHGLHVIIGMGAIGWILVRSVKGHFSSEYFGPVDYVGLYWHLVDLVWIYLFPLLYLID
jgi:cytochrome c oxidase subunit 3